MSLALVVINFLLVAFLFYSGSATLTQRAAMTDLIVGWQRDTDKLMANCVSQDVTKMMLDNMQKITETMLGTAQKDIERMQTAIEKERETVRKLIEQMLPVQRPPTSWSQPKPIDFEECDPLGPFCMPI